MNDDAERAFRDALHRVDSVRIPVPPIEATQVRRASWSGLPVGRWLAAAALVAMVAGLSVWALSGRGQSLTAVPAAPVSAAPRVMLTGATWLAIDLYGTPAEPAPDAVPYLKFETDSTFAGGDPCNGFNGTYRLIGDELTLGVLAKTEIGCNGAQQGRFDRALSETRRVQRNGDTLELLDQPGNVLARFRATVGQIGAGPGPTPSVPATAATDMPTTVPPDTPTSSGEDPAAAVEVRIRNASDLDFDSVELGAGEDALTFGTVRSGAQTGFQKTASIYRNPYVKIVIAGKPHVYQPVDQVGETPLTSGRHSLVIDLVGGDIRVYVTEAR